MSKLSQTFSKQKTHVLPSETVTVHRPHGAPKGLGSCRLSPRWTRDFDVPHFGGRGWNGGWRRWHPDFFWGGGLEKWSTGKRVFGKGCRNCCDHHEYHHQWMMWWCVGCHCDGGGRGFKKEQQKWSEKSKPNCKNPAETSPPKFRCFSL